MKLYHCQGARSFRPLWALEELGIPYELELMPFPPRLRQEGYLDLNPLGTVPTFVDRGEILTESVAICHYLAGKTAGTPLTVRPDEAGYGRFLNTLYQSDATLTFPQTLFLRYRVFEKDRGLGQVGDDYVQWFFSRLKGAAAMLGDREFVAADRFTIADICFGYALKLAVQLDLGELPPAIAAYWQRLQARDGYQRALIKDNPRATAGSAAG